jgi:hypothetical protein
MRLLEASMAGGIGQALAGWAIEYTHNLIEGDPELRAELRRNWRAMFERICQLAEAEEQSAPKRPRRGSSHAR